MTEPGNRTTTYLYDAARGISGRINPDGTTTQILAGFSLKVPNLNPTGTTYANRAPSAFLGRFTETVSAQFTDERGKVTSYELDRWGLPVKFTNAKNEVVTMLRNANGHLTSRSEDPDGNGPLAPRTTTYAVDAKGGRTTITHPDLSTESWIFDPVYHQPLQYTDELNRVTKYSLDAFGNWTTVRRIVGLEDLPTNSEFNDQVTTMTWDQERLTSHTDPVGRITTFQYHPYAQNTASSQKLSQVVEGVGAGFAGTTTYAYALNTSDKTVTITVTDALNYRTEIKHDTLDRVVLIKEPNPSLINSATGPEWEYEYDSRHNLVEMTDPLDRVTVYQYNTMNRLTQRTDPDPDGLIGSLVSPVTTFTYWNTGELKTETNPLLRTTDFEIDDLGRRTKIKQPAPVGVSPRPEWVFNFDGYGDLTSSVDPLLRTTNYSYDLRHRLNTVTEPAPVGTSPRPITEYMRDAAGQITEIKDPRFNTIIYGHDTLGRVISETTPDPDAGGPLVPLVTNYRYNAADDLVGLLDPRGNLFQIEFDARRRVTRELQPIVSPTASPQTSTIDSSSATQTTSSGTWNTTSSGGYNNDQRVSTGTGTFNWNFTGLTVGKTYEVLVTYKPNANSVATAAYTVKNGGTTIASATLDQRNRPGDVIDSIAHPWERIAVINSAPATSLTVSLSGTTNGIADAVRFVEIGGSTQRTYDLESQLLTEKDLGGFVTSFQHDGLERLIRVTEPDPDGTGGPLTSPVTQFVYDLVHNVTGILDPRASTNAVQFPYQNPLNRLDVNANGIVEPLDANLVNNYIGTFPGTIPPYVDVNGDGIVAPLDALLVINQLGTNPPEPVQPLATILQYDGLDRLVRRYDPKPGPTPGISPEPVTSFTSYAYDVASRMTSMTDPMGRMTSYGYDNLDRQTTETLPDPDGSGPLGFPVFTTGYDLKGNIISTRDPRNLLTTYGIDGLDRRASITDPLSGVTSFSYDFNDNLKTLTDAQGNTTTWHYDTVNRATSEVNSLTKTRSMEYDPNGNLTKIIDRRGLERRFAYDRWNRPISENWHASPGGASVAGYTFAYNANSSLTSASGSGTHSSSASYVFGYDNLERLTSTDMSGIGFPTVRRLTQGYDPNGNRTSLKAKIGTVDDFSNTYGYDRMDRLVSVQQVQQSASSAAAPKYATLEYNKASQLTSLKRFNASTHTNLIAQTDRGYNAAGWLESITHKNSSGTPITGVGSYSWTYDVAARMKSYTVTNFSAESVTNFDYDNRDQLTLADRVNTANDETYGFDATGNRTTGSFVPGTNNRYATVQLGTLLYTPTYDDEGNLTRLAQNGSTNTIDFTYDYRKRMTQVQYKTGSTVTKQANYTYDPFDRRVQKSVDLDGGGSGAAVLTKWVYDGQNPVLEFNGNNGLSHRYLYGDMVDQVLAVEKYVPPATANWLPMGAGTVYTPLQDQVNSVRDIVNASGLVVNHLNYDSFGVIQGESNPALDFLFGFGGFVRDEETGLNLSDTRFYSPDLGRWMNEDFIGFLGGDANLNRYVGNAPNTWIDPSGMEPPDEHPNDIRKRMQKNYALRNELLLDTMGSNKAARDVAKLQGRLPGDVQNAIVDTTINLATAPLGGGASMVDDMADAANHARRAGWFDWLKSLFQRGKKNIDCAEEVAEAAARNAPVRAISSAAQKKGDDFFKGFAKRNPTNQTMKQIGDFTEFAIEVPGNNGKSFTRWVKVVGPDGRTIRLYHDTFDNTGKFINRGIKVPGPDRHVP